MATYKTLEEVKKDYPTLNIGNFTDFQKNYLLNHNIKTIDKDYNINCRDCRNCRNCIDCIICRNCIGCIGCRDCRDCTNCKDCNHFKDYINNKPKK